MSEGRQNRLLTGNLFNQEFVRIMPQILVLAARYTASMHIQPVGISGFHLWCEVFRKGGFDENV